jgi:tetratricopeptide (TPR) repeat protein
VIALLALARRLQLLTDGLHREYLMSADYMEVAEEDIIEEQFVEDYGDVEVRVEVPGGELDCESAADLGLAFREMGLWDTAVLFFKRALSGGHPRPAHCRLLLGMCHMDDGHLAEAIRELKDGLAAPGADRADKVMLLYHLGLAFLELPDHEEALYHFRRAERLRPNFQDIRRLINDLIPTRVVGTWQLRACTPWARFLEPLGA